MSTSSLAVSPGLADLPGGRDEVLPFGEQGRFAAVSRARVFMVMFKKVPRLRLEVEVGKLSLRSEDEKLIEERLKNEKKK